MTRRNRTWVLVALAFAVAFVGVNPEVPSAGAATATFTVKGSGWGHGVGMSQWGARGRAANRGESYDQILRHYYTGTTIAAGRPISNNVRVLIADAQQSVTLGTSGATTISSLGSVGAGAAITATRSGSRIVLGGAVQGTVDSPVRIDLNSSGGAVSVAGKDSYRFGTLSIDTGSTSGLRVIVTSLTMEQYLLGIGEVPSSWPAEALKAQATAARTYAQKQIEARRSNPAYAYFDLNSTLDGAYRGTRFEREPTNRNWVSAVNSTSGTVILHNGTLIDAVYSASSGGHTANSETVWYSAVPYLRGVPDPDDLSGNPHANWSASYTAAELGAWFAVGNMTSMRISGTIPTGGHLDKTSISVVGTSGSKTLTGAEFRSTINARAGSTRMVRSTLFQLPDGLPGSGPPPPPPTTPPPPPTTTTPPPPPPPRNTPATGKLLVATTDQRRVIIAGDAVDPDGPPLVRVVSTMGRQRGVYDYRATNGKFLVTWIGSPGTRHVCVTLYDTPTGAASSLGCRDIVVK